MLVVARGRPTSAAAVDNGGLRCLHRPEAPWLPTDPMLPPDTSGVQLSPDEVARFSRHLILPEVGMEGQKRL